MSKKKSKETFKNTYPIILIAYIIVIILGYAHAYKYGFSSEGLHYRLAAEQIAGYIMLPIGFFVFTYFDKNISDTKSHKIMLIVTHILFLLVDFYPTLLAIKAMFV